MLIPRNSKQLTYPEATEKATATVLFFVFVFVFPIIQEYIKYIIFVRKYYESDNF